MKRARSRFWPIGVLVAVFSGEAARGQFVVERQFRPAANPSVRSYEVREVAVNARLRDGVAEVQVAQTFHNPGSTTIEAEYLFPLPEDAAVGDLVLMVDGRELPGRVLPKADARRIYEEIVRTKRDPALLEYMGRGVFRASVFPIPPGADRVVTLRYTQVCRRDRDVIEFAFPLAIQKQAGKPIGKLDLVVRVDGRDAIKSVYSPEHDVRITRPSEREATATLERRDVVPTTDFRLVYTLGEGAVGASLLSYRPSEAEDGYFLLLASPRVKAVDARPLPKTVVFVLDRSGSMAGKKIDQAKGALQFVLDNLRDDDTFNIVAYDDQVETYKPELQRYSARTREEATRFVANIRSGGGTDIDGGLKAAMALISDDSRPNYVIFLTDGLPTNGETLELKIAENTRVANKAKARIFAFGVGFDVNARLLDRVSGASGGTSEYVRPDEDLEAHVGAFYSKLTRPVLSGIAVELAGCDVNRTYPRNLPDLFEGGQLAWVGRYPKGGSTTIKVTGKVGGERQSFEFPAELAGPGSSSGRDFVAKLWAVRRVGFIIDQIDLNGPNSELTDELVALSTRYGLLTQYTSFLADERVPLHARAANMRQAAENLSDLKVIQGPSGTMQRGAKQGFIQADRFNDVDVAMSMTAPAAAESAAPNAAANPFFDRSRGRAQGGMAAAKAGVAGGFAGGGGGIGGQSGMDSMRRESRKQASPDLAVAGRRPDRLGGATGDPAANIRRVGTKTFFRKDGRWVDSEVKPEDNGKAIVVEQFGDEFFRLAARQSAEQNQYFSFDEPVTVRIADRIYRVDPPKVP